MIFKCVECVGVSADTEFDAHISPAGLALAHLNFLSFILQASVYDFVDNEMSLSANQTSDKSNIKATDSSIGFLGLGNMGQPIVRNLIKYGHKVSIWNRSDRKVSRQRSVVSLHHS